MEVNHSVYLWTKAKQLEQKIQKMMVNNNKKNLTRIKSKTRMDNIKVSPV